MPNVTWITPRTFVDGTKPPASFLNEITTDLSILGAADSARVYNTITQSLSSQGQWGVINFDAEYWNRGGMHSLTSNPSRLTAQRSGLYFVGGSVQFGGAGDDYLSNGSGGAGLAVTIGAGTFIASSFASSQGPSANQLVTVASLWFANAGDYFQLQAMTRSTNIGDQLKILGPDVSSIGPAASPVFWAVCISN